MLTEDCNLIRCCQTNRDNSPFAAVRAGWSCVRRRATATRPGRPGGAVRPIATSLRSAQLGQGEPASGGERLPFGQGGRAVELVGLSVEEVAFGGEVVVKRGVD